MSGLKILARAGLQRSGCFKLIAWREREHHCKQVDSTTSTFDVAFRQES